MKPEHAQEIYEMIERYSELTRKYDFDSADEDQERARELLELERPDVPESGTIVEVRDVGDEYTSWAKFDSIEPNGDIWVVEQIAGGHNTVIRVSKWRYPGEKEWRE